MGVDDFDALHDIARTELEKEMDPRQKSAPSSLPSGRSSARAMSKAKTLLMFYLILSGPSEGSYGVESVWYLFGVSRETV